MNKKGFTLIELIATIAILGVILSITFVSFHSITQRNKYKRCDIYYKSIVAATREYILDNRYNTNFFGTNSKTGEIELKNPITIQTLLEKHYLKGEMGKDNNISIEVIMNDDYTMESALPKGHITDPKTKYACPLKGDINKNNRLDCEDLNKIMKFNIRAEKPTDEELYLADANSDDSVDILDGLVVLKRLSYEEREACLKQNEEENAKNNHG